MPIEKTVFVRVAWCLLVGMLPAAGQALDTLKGKPETVFRFFNLHDAVSNEIDRLAASRPADAQDLVRRASATYGIDQAEFVKLRPIAVRGREEIRKIVFESIRYRSGITSSGQKPDPAVMRRFRLRKEQAILAEIDQLSSVLSQSSRDGLRAYVLGPFSKNIPTGLLPGR